MKRPFHSRASRDVRPRCQSAARRSMVSPGARLVRVEHVGRVEGGSIKPIARPLWGACDSSSAPTIPNVFRHNHSPKPAQQAPTPHSAFANYSIPVLLSPRHLFLFLDNNNLGSIDDLGLVKYNFVKAKCLLNYV